MQLNLSKISNLPVLQQQLCLTMTIFATYTDIKHEPIAVKARGRPLSVSQSAIATKIS